MKFKTADFSYYLPPELIAQEPVKPRDHSRLLVLFKNRGTSEHQRFFEIVDYLQAGDILVLNNSKVFPARLHGHKRDSGGAVEIFLHQKIADNSWECLVRGRLKTGQIVDLSAKLFAVVGADNQDGTRNVVFNLTGSAFFKEINRIGEVPLPPYIKNPRGEKQDKVSYQTVFAASGKDGSAAAPTAGLHFTTRLLKKIEAKGVKVRFITLHVGLGTFAPVKTEYITDHKMHSESVEIKAEVWEEILAAKQSGKRVVAVGTTSCRSLEAAATLFGDKIQKSATDLFFRTNIFIYPGYTFKIVDALVTNFHLPESTLLMLVSALAGKDNILRVYNEAISQNYRFFSYGDAMLII